MAKILPSAPWKAASCHSPLTATGLHETPESDEKCSSGPVSIATSLFPSADDAMRLHGLSSYLSVKPKKKSPDAVYIFPPFTMAAIFSPSEERATPAQSLALSFLSQEEPESMDKIVLSGDPTVISLDPLLDPAMSVHAPLESAAGDHEAPESTESCGFSRYSEAAAFVPSEDTVMPVHKPDEALPVQFCP